MSSGRGSHSREGSPAGSLRTTRHSDSIADNICADELPAWHSWRSCPATEHRLSTSVFGSALGGRVARSSICQIRSRRGERWSACHRRRGRAQGPTGAGPQSSGTRPQCCSGTAAHTCRATRRKLVLGYTLRHMGGHVLLGMSNTTFTYIENAHLCANTGTRAG